MKTDSTRLAEASTDDFEAFVSLDASHISSIASHERIVDFHSVGCDVRLWAHFGCKGQKAGRAKTSRLVMLMLMEVVEGILR